MRHGGALALALVLLAVGAAGCMGEGELPPEDAGSRDLDPNTAPASDDAATAGDEAPDAEAEDAPAALAFPPDTALDVTRWENGTFAAGESCLPAGCVTGDATRSVELDGLPGDAPTTVRAELTYESGMPFGFGHIDMYLDPGDGTVYQWEGSSGEGQETVEATLLPGTDPATVELFYAVPGGSEREANYTLRIDLENAPGEVPAGVPVAADVEGGQRLELAPASPDANPGDLALIAYDPDDALVGEVRPGEPARLELPDDAGRGAHVFAAPVTAPPVRLLAEDAGAELRALHLALERGPVRQVEPVQPVNWTFELDGRPLAVGIAWSTTEPMSAAVGPGEVTVTGPEGTVLEGTVGCGICLGAGGTSVMTTPVGDADVVPGAYEAVYEPVVEARTEVGHVLVTYER